MARGRKPGVKIHEAATALYREFSKLSEDEQNAFFNKYFAGALRGCDKKVKAEVKEKFSEIQSMISAVENEKKSREMLKAIPTAVLQAEIAKRTPAKAAKK